jgi:hypothetical protein
MMSERIPWKGEREPGDQEAHVETAFDRFRDFAQGERARSVGLVFNLRLLSLVGGPDFFILEAGTELDGFHVESTYLASGTREQVSEFGLRWAEEGLTSGHFVWRGP